MTTTVQSAIDAARNAAAAYVASTGTDVAVRPTAGLPAMPGKPLGMSDLMSGGISVDHWLKVKDDGLIIGDNRTDKLDNIVVEIDMSAVQVAYAVKYDQGKVYKKSYDGVTTVGGGSWADTVAMAARRPWSSQALSSAPRASDL